MTIGKYDFVFFIVKITSLSLPPAAKTQFFVYLSFSSTSRLINGISSVLQKLLRYFNGTEIL